MPALPEFPSVDVPSERDAASRRTFLKGTAVAGLLMLFGRDGAGAATPTTKKRTTATTKKPATLTPTKAGAFSATDELVVSYSYVALGGRGRVHNPYSAIWVETAAGALVRTIDLSLQAGKGRKWWPDLKRWWRADQARLTSGGAAVIDTISSATRIPGSYSASWDGKDHSGAFVANGEYTLLVEAAREKGPYSLVRQPITINGSPFVLTPADNEELQGVRIEFKPRSA